MRKLNFYNKKGFTLVECIVAIAVFAVMTSMVMIIISSAIDTTRQSVNGERDLNQMVEAVENDQAIRKYDAGDSRTLVMRFGEPTATDKDPNFSITYSTTDGYMNYMSCPRCGYIGSRLEFIKHIVDSYTYKNSSDTLKDKYSYSYWFDPILKADNNNEAGTYNVEGVTFDSKDNSDDTRQANFNTQKKKFITYLRKFVCPNCEQIVENGVGNANEVRPLYCLTCDNEGSPYGEDVQTGDAATSKGFHWDNKTGSFYCNKCGSSYVIEKGMKEKLGAGSQFNIGGIFPNAIRYGSIESPSNDNVKTFVAAENTAGDELSNYSVKLNVTSYASTLPDKYQITISNLTSAVTNNKDVTFTFQLPPGYMIPTMVDASDKTKTKLNLGMVNGTSGTLTWKYTNGADASEGSQITLKNVKTGTTPSFTFTLVNVKSGNSFDADYADEGGLADFWFKIKDTNGASDTFTVPRTFKTSS